MQRLRHWSMGLAKANKGRSCYPLAEANGNKLI
jgi:hypothetical protein